MAENILNDLLGEVVQDNNKASPAGELSTKEKCRYSLIEFVKNYLATEDLDALIASSILPFAVAKLTLII